jgi:hypothetical protein
MHIPVKHLRVISFELKWEQENSPNPLLLVIKTNYPKCVCVEDGSRKL